MRVSTIRFQENLSRSNSYSHFACADAFSYPARFLNTRYPTPLCLPVQTNCVSSKMRGCLSFTTSKSMLLQVFHLVTLIGAFVSCSAAIGCLYIMQSRALAINMPGLTHATGSWAIKPFWPPSISTLCVPRIPSWPVLNACP